MGADFSKSNMKLPVKSVQDSFWPYIANVCLRQQIFVNIDTVSSSTLIKLSDRREGPSIDHSQLYSNRKELCNIDYFIPLISADNIYFYRQNECVEFPVTFASAYIVPHHISPFNISSHSISEMRVGGSYVKFGTLDAIRKTSQKKHQHRLTYRLANGNFTICRGRGISTLLHPNFRKFKQSSSPR